MFEVNRLNPHKMAPQVGLEATVKRKRKHLQSTDGTESLRKAVVVHGN
jgi:hypothetical protein